MSHTLGLLHYCNISKTNSVSHEQQTESVTALYETIMSCLRGLSVKGIIGRQLIPRKKRTRQSNPIPPGLWAPSREDVLSATTSVQLHPPWPLFMSNLMSTFSTPGVPNVVPKTLQEPNPKVKAHQVKVV